MTSNQEKLMPYVESVVNDIIIKKEEDNIRPLCVNDVEVTYGVRNDVLECMRELHRSGKYQGVNGLNHPMLLKKEN